MNINEFCKEAHETAVEKDFYSNNNRNIAELLMLIVSELSEALEAARKLNYCLFDFKNLYWNDILNTIIFETKIKDTFEDEIADAFIRLADLCGYLNIDIEKFIKAKMEYNKTRPIRHGKNF